MSVLELGACQGDTTRIFSELFKKVYAVDRDPENIQKLRQNHLYLIYKDRKYFLKIPHQLPLERLIRK